MKVRLFHDSPPKHIWEMLECVCVCGVEGEGGGQEPLPTRFFTVNNYEDIQILVNMKNINTGVSSELSLY